MYSLYPDYMQLLHPIPEATGLPDGKDDDERICWKPRTGLRIPCEMKMLRNTQVFNEEGFGYTRPKIWGDKYTIHHRVTSHYQI